MPLPGRPVTQRWSLYSIADSQQRCKRGTSKSRSNNGNHDDDIVGYMIDGETMGFLAEPDQDPGLNVQHMNGAEDQAEWDEQRYCKYTVVS
jgi:hypothetical protein